MTITDTELPLAALAPAGAGDPPSSVPEYERPASERGLSGPHIVIGEDDHDDFELFEELLREIRPDVRLTRFLNGKDLVDRFMGPTLDARLLVLDLNMPIKDGRQALLEIKADSRYRSLPVVVLTTSAASSDEIYARGFENTTFRTKPMAYSDYRQLVHALVKSLAAPGPAQDDPQ